MKRLLSMALTVRFTGFAFSEMEDTKEYYNLQQENLGDVFKQDFRNVVDRIHKFPKLYPIVMGDIRKCTLHRFPYNLFYAITEDVILVLAVANHHRKPYYWVKSAAE